MNAVPPPPAASETDRRLRTAIVVLNWRRAGNTIECLESLLKLRNAHFRIVVCDNASGDDSGARILSWARSNRLTIARLGTSGGPDPEGGAAPSDPMLTLIDVGENRGFAGGINAGLRYAMARGDFSHYWILNNDTVVEPGALEALVARVGDDPTIGLCGSTVRQYVAPHALEVCGGFAFDPVAIEGAPVRDSLGDDVSIASVEARLDFIVGASMFATHAFLAEIGLMPEDYFLYYEEIDWALRVKGRFRLGWAPDSVVYHRRGATTGAFRAGTPSDIALWFRSRNKLLFARRHAPQSSWRVRRELARYALFWLIRRRYLRGAWLVFQAVIWDMSGREPSQQADAAWVARVGESG